MFTTDYIITHTNATAFGTHPQTVSCIDFDTRRLEEKSLFIALTIGQRDGHAYIKEAIKQGATVILLSNDTYIEEQPGILYLLVEDTLLAFQSLAAAYRNDLTIPVIGITGSNGKTTTKDLMANLLSTKLDVHATFGNFNNHLGVPLTILQTKEEHDVLILEMGMNHAGELDTLGRIAQPNVVIITNIGESHIAHFGSREGIAHAKGELLTHLRPNGIAFIPYDCPYKTLLSAKTSEDIVYFGVQKEAELHASSIQTTPNGTTFTCFDTMQLTMPLFGEHNVVNVLPAIYLADYYDFIEKDIAHGLTTIRISPMRFELIQGPNGISIINDAYNASPTSMKTSIATFLSIFQAKRCVLVLGDMFELGEQAVSLHQEMGRHLSGATELIECIVTVGDHSRFISSSFKGVHRHFPTHEEAARWLQGFMHEDFALFFKASRGMKMEKIIDLLQ